VGARTHRRRLPEARPQPDPACFSASSASRGWLLDALTTEPLAFETLGAAEDVMGLIEHGL
jgi:hypothetical protein